MEESKLARWVEEGGGEPPRLVFVIGKGGVGKTTASIILAYELARRNRVLLVSLDQAMHLLEYLGMRKPMKKERIVEGLDAVQVDVNVLIRKESMDYVNLMQSVMPGLTVVNADDVVKSLKFNPGFEEEVYLRYISGLFGEKEYDYIVVDTPPTGV
nr:ArsA family ATPase [Desulfurococcales archaeon]